MFEESAGSFVYHPLDAEDVKVAQQILRSKTNRLIYFKFKVGAYTYYSFGTIVGYQTWYDNKNQAERIEAGNALVIGHSTNVSRIAYLILTGKDYILRFYSY